MYTIALYRLKGSVSLTLFVLLFSIFVPYSSVQAAPGIPHPQINAAMHVPPKTETGSHPLESILNRDGTLKLDGSTQGSFSTTGWQMISGGNGQPRFIHAQHDQPANPLALAGDSNWRGDFNDGVSSGPYSASIRAIAVSGSDVYVGGFFSQAGGIPANNIATWNTTTHRWDSLNGGINGQVYAIVPQGNFIYVGGSFNDIHGTSANSLARWDTVAHSWSLVGGTAGLTSGNGKFVGVVYALAFDASGNLYVGGSFDHAGNLPVANIARWNGTAWSSLGSGLGGANDSVLALAASGSSLFAGGIFSTPFTNVAHWDGTNWNGMGGINGKVSTFLLDGNNLYAGGSFTQAGITDVHNLAVWTGGSTWQDVGGGTDGEVTDIVSGPGGLYLTGGFKNVGSVSAQYAALWNGNTWSSLSYGVSAEAYAVAVTGNLVWIGGDFRNMRFDSSNHIAIWNSTDHIWYGVGNSVNGPVYAVAISGSDVYLGGDFNSAGGIPAENIARWNSRTGLWSDLDLGVTGCNGPVCTPTVWALAVNGGNIFVGGNFMNVGNHLRIAARNLALWDTQLQMWRAAEADGCPAVDPNCTTAVYAIVPDGSGVDFGGYFMNACNYACHIANNVGYWDGSVIRVFTDGSTIGVGNGSVSALLNDGAGVYIAGQFTSPRTNLVYFDGTDFFGLGSPLGTFITALAEDNQYLYAGGMFTNAGGNGGANNIARISLTTTGDWQPVGGGFDDVVLGLAFSGPELIAVGSFTKNGTTGLNHIARWNTTAQTWAPIGSGADGLVNSVAANQNEIFVGGRFIQMGGKESDYFASWASFSSFFPSIVR